MTMTEARFSRDALAWGNSLLHPALREAVGALAPPTRLVSGYHLGWWDERGHRTAAAEGKALRPTLVLLTARAAGGRAEDALPAAVAVELVHNFSLLHDDVMDRDVVRRGRPTAWTVFGIGPAVLVGDALLNLALELVADSGHQRADDAVAALSAAVLKLVDGQLADLEFESRDDVGLQECWTMAAAKTGALLGCACALGGMLGGASTEQVDRLQAFGVGLGLAFQLVDDILGIWGDPSVTGKPVSSDLWSRKKSLPVVAALSSGTAEARALASIYAADAPLSDDEVVHVRELVEQSGARAWSEVEADRQRDLALEQLEAARLQPRAAAGLLALADLVTSRDR